ncbi:MAG: histidinol dehydrogenase [Alphaproteobacteria bacterium]|nr:histidinol dehydrogenase [Alphaproteobacteria bacterium]
MPTRLEAQSAGFAAAFEQLVAARREAAVDVRAAVVEILAAVRQRGDAALIELSERFDRVSLTPANLSVPAGEIAAAWATADPDLRQALDLAAARIEDFHRRQLPVDQLYRDAQGVTLGHRWTALSAVGIYVPGGLAAYPSSVLMTAVPARLAGVPRIAMAVPAPDGRLNPLVLAAAHRAGVSEIYRIGGAQAVAALAFGTASIAAVDKVVGPGNAYVAEAKRQVFGHVGIDAIAGPSEILVLADGMNDAGWIAADLLSQAEHDETAQAILITDDTGLADRVVRAVAEQLAALPRRAIAEASWRAHGAVIVVGALELALPLIDRLAPEHLVLSVAEPEKLASRVRHAGAIFLGRHTPETIGDYLGGPNHVLPTARAARFSSGLGVLDFMKRTSLLGLDGDALARLGPAAMRLAEAEGLTAHARAVAIRLAGLTVS